MISVAEALEALFGLVAPLDAEVVPLREAAGRVLARDLVAAVTQPPFPASAMDGYAVRDADLAPGQPLKVIGESAAGHGFDGVAAPGTAVRIFTGAPVPAGFDRVVIQEDVIREGDIITSQETLDSGFHIRAAGQDFAQGARITAPRLISPSDVALFAAMGHARVPVTRKPQVAIIATGDELVQPGETPGPDQIIASNSYGLAALCTAHGAAARLLPIARDTAQSLRLTLDLAADADLIVTIGGASVGDHDLVGQVAADAGLDRAFYKIAMRPGKPLMAGRLGDVTLLGLPGNPVSAMVCGHIFMLPMLRVMQGLPAHPAPRATRTLARDIPANGPREHYMRAWVDGDGVTVFDRQDSALLTVLADANALAVRPPHDPPRAAGDTIEVVQIS